MKLIEIKCPNCHSNLNIKESKSKKIICEYCNTEFLLDDDTKIVKHIIEGQITEEQEFINAQTNLNILKNYDESYECYLKLSKKYVNNKDIWLGLLRSLTHDFTYKYGSETFKVEYQKYWNNFKSLASPSDIDIYKEKYHQYDINTNASDKASDSVKKEKCFFIATVFGGWFGLHHYLNKNYIMGIVYTFSYGLFGIGWFYDIYKEAKKWPNSNQIKITRYIMIFFYLVIGLALKDYFIPTFILCLISAFLMFNIFWDLFNIKNIAARIFIPIFIFFVGIIIGPTALPENLEGNWLPIDNNTNIDYMILKENDTKIYIDGIEYHSTYNNYYKGLVFIEMSTEKDYKFKYDDDTKHLCLLDESENCVGMFELSQN